MEGNGKSCLPEGVDFVGFAYDFAAGRNEKVLTVVRVNVVGEQADDRAGKTTVKPVDEQRFKNCPFKQDVVLSFVRKGKSRPLRSSVRSRSGWFSLILTMGACWRSGLGQSSFRSRKR